MLLRDGKAIGKLVQPRVTSVCLGVEQGEEKATAAVVSECSIAFERWCPAAAVQQAGAAASAQPLCLPVDEAFERSTFRVQVIGRQGSSSFAVPHIFLASGQELATALTVEQQRLEYIRGHQQRRGAAPTSPPAAPATAEAAPTSTVTVSSGACMRTSKPGGRCLPQRLVRTSTSVLGDPCAVPWPEAMEVCIHACMQVTRGSGCAPSLTCRRRLRSSR